TGQTLIVSGNETLGDTAAFTLTLNSGSTHSVTGNLTLASTGLLNLAGGTLNATGLDFNGPPFLFNWTAGTLNLNSNVIWDSAAASTTTGDAFGSSLMLGTSQTLQISGNETLGGVGAFTLTLSTGSTHAVTGILTLNPTGTLVLNGGSLTFASLNQSGGTITGNLSVPVGSTYNYAGGSLNGQLLNAGTATLSANFTNSAGVTNSGTLNISAGVTATFTVAPISNSGTINLNGGSIAGAGTLTNNGAFAGFGTIASTAINNNGSFTVSGGSLVITSYAFNNYGNINLSTTGQLQCNGNIVSNSGTITLNGSSISGSALLANAAGGTISGSGSITTPFSNSGTVALTANTLTLPAFTNNGDIELAGITATLAGSTITNASTIEGFGKINNPITNNSTIEATGGTLILTGTLANSANGTLAVSSGNKILIQGTSIFPTNAGLISLTGGTFDTSTQTLNNTGSIVGYGTLRTAGLTNSGIFDLTGGTSTINGNIINASGKTINILYQPAIFTGNITNNGTINVTGTTITYTGTYTGNAYHSDPSTNIFQNNVTVVAGGQMTGGSGDQYYMSGGTFTNQGTFSNGGWLQSSDPTTNSGSFSESGAQNWSNGTTFTNTAGTATFNSDTGSATSSPLSIAANGGLVTFGSNQHLASLSISPGATVDVMGNELFISSASAATIRSYLISAYDHGTWNETGLTSSMAAANSTGSTTLGYLVVGSMVEVKYTWLGDADLDGVVDAADLAAMSPIGTTWTTGDFNYDGRVNADDYSLFMLGAAASGGMNISTTLPEPAGAAVITCGLGLAALKSRRRGIPCLRGQ
ncbi:MAG TPA: hypothetical protein VGG19_01875, partial [Tepidisphaeraceae bacterium]